MFSKNIFESTTQKTNHILSDIEGKLEVERHHAYAIFRAVLHTLRDRLPVNEAVDLGAQLPMLVRGFYYEGWKPSQTPIKMSREEFLKKVEDQINFPIEYETEEIVHRVFDVMRLHISGGEMEDVHSVLPKKFDDLFE